jgi:O-antigen/teichoic acid export membrane protein
VVNLLAAEQNAYFYIAWTIGNILFLVPTAVSTALFAEGSYNEEGLRHNVIKSIKLTTFILGVAVLFILLLSNKLLLLFGEGYSENATHLLWILALSALPMSVNYVYISIKRVEMKMRMGVVSSLFIAVVTLVLSYVLLPRIGIIGAGVAILISQSAAAIILGISILRYTE